ncbi:hypothetical protein GQ44DRAFT_123300 [Phaeosphaeriaceae sp. PMI808]|nr:hypothetical protein GQ44DRAFT_123300 [Phaeosphaeriaceae sp. PMI808]
MSISRACCPNRMRLLQPSVHTTYTLHAPTNCLTAILGLLIFRIISLSPVHHLQRSCWRFGHPSDVHRGLWHIHQVLYFDSTPPSITHTTSHQNKTYYFRSSKKWILTDCALPLSLGFRSSVPLLTYFEDCPRFSPSSWLCIASVISREALQQARSRLLVTGRSKRCSWGS